MSDEVIFDVILWTTVIVALWYWRREKQVIRSLLDEKGLRLPLPGAEEEAVLPRLEPDVDIPSARVLTTARAGLQLEADVLLRNRPGQTATLRLGLLRADGSPLPHPAGSSWCRFEDGLETLGGSLRTDPAARSFAYWHAQGLEIPRADVPLPDGATSLQMRVEVWIDGRKEATTLLHQRLELGARGPAPQGGEDCVACHRSGAELHCPRCREPHHDACFQLNRGCTRLACAVQMETSDPYARGGLP